MKVTVQQEYKLPLFDKVVYLFNYLETSSTPRITMGRYAIGRNGEYRNKEYIWIGSYYFDGFCEAFDKFRMRYNEYLDSHPVETYTPRYKFSDAIEKREKEKAYNQKVKKVSI